MSSSNDTVPFDIQTEINTINHILVSMGRWAFPSTILFGIVSNTLNIFVFTRPPLRRNPCCMYFLSSSIAALLFTVISGLYRTLQAGYSIDSTAYSLAVCKLTFFFLFSWRTDNLVSCSGFFGSAKQNYCGLVPLFLFRRFLHSSSEANVRRWSSYKLACRAIPLTFFVVHLVYSHVLISYEILLPRRTCSIGNTAYNIFLGIWHLITYGTGPPLLMLVFSLLTIRHVRQRRIVPTTSLFNQGNLNSSKDKHLLRMVFVQCLVVGSTTTAFAIGQWYITLTSNQNKTNLQLAKDALFFNFVGCISAIGHCTTFFVFTLTSKMFREQLLCRRQ